jgi:hypothetical protein
LLKSRIHEELAVEKDDEELDGEGEGEGEDEEALKDQ